MTLAGVELELFDFAGSGPTLLFLHGVQGFCPLDRHAPSPSCHTRVYTSGSFSRSAQASHRRKRCRVFRRLGNSSNAVRECKIE